MKKESILLQPIGLIHTPFNESSGMPIQPKAGEGVKGTVAVFPEFKTGLKDLDGFSHITLLYRFHKIGEYQMETVPFMDTEKRGIFACRAPNRPNFIGLSTVRLIRIEGLVLHIQDVDMLNGTPLIDIKPYFPDFDTRENACAGWLDRRRSLPKGAMISDGRFRT